MKAEQLKLIGTMSVSVALIVFSIAIIMFTNELAQTRKAVPQLISQIESIEKNVNMPEILAQISNIINKLPMIVNEVSEVRKQVPLILKQLEETRKQVPLVLNQVEEMRKMIPPILDEMSATREQIPKILHEIEQTRLLIPDILNESQALRKDVPLMMLEADKLMHEAQETATIVGENAVQGTLKAVITSPYTILKKSKNALVGGEKDE